MRKIQVVIILFIFILINSQSAAAANSKLKEIDSIVDEALQMAHISRFEESLMLLEYFSEQMTHLTMTESVFSLDDLKVISNIYDEAVEAMKDDSVDKNERINKILKLRLITDAFTSNYAPLWVEMEDEVLSALENVKESFLIDDEKSFKEQLKLFLSTYETIYPSMSLEATREMLFLLDKQVTYISQYKINKDENRIKHFSLLEDNLRTVFSRVTEDEADPSLWWVIFSTGGIISITLIYVGWRKYLGDRNKKRTKSKQLND